jgi:YcaO-like protein with predicted kinase domain
VREITKSTIHQSQRKRESKSNQIVHRLGTFRSASPSESLVEARRAAKICGVSRLAGVTGLDHIGIPVWTAIRPLGKSLSVTQGKGLTDELAQVSALMEAIELFHAETLLPTGLERSIKVTVRDPSFADVQGLPIRSKRRLNFESPIHWLETRSIITGEPKWIPRELIDLDSTQVYAGFFVSSSNGLASGNSRIEAVLHGLSEIVERDQVSHWLIAENLSIGSSSRRLKLSCGLPASVGRVVTMIKDAGLDVAVWHASTTLEVPCFACAIADIRGNTLFPQHAAGYGCHVSKEIALLRALTEAAQTRLTFISGARDDLFLKVYENDVRIDAPSNRAWVGALEFSCETISYDELPDFSHFRTFSDAVDFIASSILDDGVTDVYALDLTNDRIGVPVVYVSAPFIEYDVSSRTCEPGLRLCKFLRTLKRK